MDASEHDMYYLIPNDSIAIPKSDTDGALYDKLDKFRHEKLNGRNQIAMLFKDPKQVGEFVDGYKFADALWNIASNRMDVNMIAVSCLMSIPYYMI